MENITSSAIATLSSVSSSFTTLETQLQEAKVQTKALQARFEAYEKGYGHILLQPTTHIQPLCEALELHQDQPFSLDQFLQQFHQYLYNHDLYDPTTQRIILNPLLQSTFQTTNTHMHYFTLFRQLPRLFVQTQVVRPVV